MTVKSIINSFLRLAGVKLIRSDSLHFRKCIAPYGLDMLFDVSRLAGEEHVRIVVDVGANVGAWSKGVAGAFPDAAIYAFEPVSSTFEELVSQTKRCRRIRARKMALGSHRCAKSLILHANSSMNTLMDQSRAPDLAGPVVGVEDIIIDTLDSVVEGDGIDVVDLLKVDAEGWDLEVLKGASQLLSAGRIRFVYCEYWQPHKVTGHVGSLAEIAEYLCSFGLGFVASYTDYVLPERHLHAVHNALFMRAK